MILGTDKATNTTPTITLNNNTLQNVSKTLLSKALANDIEAQFQLALAMLCENRIGFAVAFLRCAAKSGHKRAKQYVLLLKKYPISTWRQLIIDVEAKFIMFEDCDKYGGK